MYQTTYYQERVLENGNGVNIKVSNDVLFNKIMK
jgi:hypothetical protein